MQQQRYWQYLVQTVGHSKYLHYYLEASEETERRIAIATALTSSASIAGWAVWHQAAEVWATVIAASQVLSAVRSHLPYAKRVEMLRDATAAYRGLAMRTESNWVRVAEGLMSEQEISDLLLGLQKEQLEIENKVFSKVTLTGNRKLLLKANAEAERYFALSYGPTQQADHQDPTRKLLGDSERELLPPADHEHQSGNASG